MANKSIDHAITATSLTSAASDPTHAGILSFMRRKYTKNLKGVDAVVWGVPFDAATSNRPGARFGPQAIRRASAIFDNDPQYPFQRDLFSQMATIDYGDCLLDYGNHQKTPQTIEREAMKILKSGAYLLTLGGDHYVTYPILKAHAAQHGPPRPRPVRRPSGHMAGRERPHRSWLLRRPRCPRRAHRHRTLDPDRHPDACAGGLRHSDRSRL